MYEHRISYTISLEVEANTDKVYVYTVAFVLFLKKCNLYMNYLQTHINRF